MKNSQINLRMAFLLVVLIYLLVPSIAGATPPGDIQFYVEFGPEFNNPLSGSWSGSFEGMADAGDATQYWSHSGNVFQNVNSHTENVLVSDKGSLTIRSNAQLTTTFLEDGFTQTGGGSFRVISGSGVYANLHGQGNVDVEVRYYNDGETEEVSVVMAFHGNSHFDP